MSDDKEYTHCLDMVVREMMMGSGRFQLFYNNKYYCTHHNKYCPAQEKRDNGVPYCGAAKMIENYRRPK